MVECNLDEKKAESIIAKASKPRKGAVTIGFPLRGRKEANAEAKIDDGHIGRQVIYTDRSGHEHFGT